MNRRHFLMGTAIIAGNAVVRGVQSPNDTVRVGIAGLGGRGSAHVSAWAAMKNVQIAGLCDVDEAHVGDKMNALDAKGVSRPTVYTDFRQMLESKDIDAVSIATPNHWHTLQTIWACQAGKDVYVEKPCSHNVFESQQIVAAARKYNRMVQQGSQNRSNPALREAVERMRSGEIGELYMARGLCYKWRDTIGKAPVEPVPPGVDYDLWLGPAPKRPFTKNRFHYNWHWFWDTGNGDIGNQGIHEIDKARWGLGVTHPTKVTAIGGKFMFDDDQETPNTISAAYEFDVDGKKRMMTFEVRHWISPHEAGIAEGTPGNTVGNQYLRIQGLSGHGWGQVLLIPGKGSPAGAERTGSRGALRELPRCRAQQEAGEPELRNRGGRALVQSGAPGQHQLSAGPDGALGCEEDGVRGRRRSEPDADSRLPQAVRRAGAGLKRVTLDWGIPPEVLGKNLGRQARHATARSHP